MRELGFDPEATPESAVAKLRELRAAPGEIEIEIARALGALAHPAAAALLAEMETTAGGALRREIRRSLFKLRQRGIEPHAASVEPASMAASADAQVTALMSPLDPEGARLVWLLKPRAQGGLLRLWGLSSDADGLVGANVTTLSRRELREERQSLEARTEAKLFDADPRYADFVLCEAYRNTPETRRAQVGNFLALRAELLTTAPPQELTHPAYAELGADIAAEPSLEVLKEPELLAWRLPDATIRPYIEEIERANQSTIVLNPMQQQERVVTIISRATGELLSGQIVQRVRRRLEDIAYQMLRSGRREQASWAAAAAAKIRDGAELGKVAFFEAFIRTQLATTVAAEQERAREEPHLIMTPAEAMRAREAAARRRR